MTRISQNPSDNYLSPCRYIGIQNGQTLKVLNLECVNISHYWQLQTLKQIIDNCVNLEEISFMSENQRFMAGANALRPS